MIITNKNNLPQAFVDAVNENHPIKPYHYSVTTLLQPIREIMLKRRYYDKIEQDVSDMVWAIFGSAVHKIMEESDKTGYAEMKLEESIINEYKLTGICDLYNEEDYSVEDYKTCSVWKIIHEEFDDWKKQGLMYAWMLRRRGYYVNKLKFHALMKDWSSKDARFNSSYPQHPVWTWYYEIKEEDLKNIEEFINLKFREIIIYENKQDDELPICSEDERWNPGNKYAVYKKAGDKRASAVLDSEEEAHRYISEKCNGSGEIQVRKGEDRKCIDYCICSKYCKYWKEHYGRTN